MDHEHRHDSPEAPEPRSNRNTIALAVLLAVAAFFLFTEHRAHLLGFLPYLLFLACPLMHLFHHGGHGHSHGSQNRQESPPDITKARHE